MDSSTATKDMRSKKNCVTCGCKDTFRDGVRVCGCDSCQKDGCVYKDCVTCGCKDEFRDGERVCGCDACQKDGCNYEDEQSAEECDPYDGATYDCLKCKMKFRNKYFNRSTFLCRICDVPGSA